MGKKIKALRCAAGLSRQEFADYFGVPRRTLENWEDGRTKPADYLLDLFEYKLQNEGLLQQKNKKGENIMKFINLVDGIKTEDGYKFSDNSEPRKPNNSSMADYMISTYAGELFPWRDESKSIIETVIEGLNNRCCHKGTLDEDPLDFLAQIPNIRWEYDSENKMFYSVWAESGKATGDVFRIESIRCVEEGQRYSEGEAVEIDY